MRYTLKHVDEFKRPWPQWLLARKSLGLESFGMNVCHLEAGEQIPEHDETARNQEEVFICLEGEATLVVDGEELPLPLGSFARIDPEAPRYVINHGEAPARVLIVSAPRDSGYQPMDWA